MKHKEEEDRELKTPLSLFAMADPWVGAIWPSQNLAYWSACYENTCHLNYLRVPLFCHPSSDKKPDWTDPNPGYYPNPPQSFVPISSI